MGLRVDGSKDGLSVDGSEEGASVDGSEEGAAVLGIGVGSCVGARDNASCVGVCSALLGAWVRASDGSTVGVPVGASVAFLCSVWHWHAYTESAAA